MNSCENNSKNAGDTEENLMEIDEVGKNAQEEVVLTPIPLTEPEPNEPPAENEEENVGKVNESAMEVGFLVDKITTAPYRKAVERGEVPFCAFSPVTTDELFLLRIQDCPDSTRHMLVPANQEDVFSTPGSLKHEHNDNEDVLDYKVALVAIARQVFNEEQKQLIVSVDPLLRKDRRKITCVNFLSLDKFTEFAFAGFDGNVSEFSKKPKQEEKPNAGTSRQSRVQNDSRMPSPDPHASQKDKPVMTRVPSRRGRGGRRGGRGRRSSPSSRRTSLPMRRGHRGRGGGHANNASSSMNCEPGPSHFQLQQFHQHQQYSMQQYQLHPSFQATAGLSFIPTDCGQGFAKVDGQLETQPYFGDVQIPVGGQVTTANTVAYRVDDEFSMFFNLPVEEAPEVPLPFSEITVGQNGADDVPPPNHDILTIAIDQLMTLNYEPETDSGMYAPATLAPSEFHQAQPERGSTSSRGGRRPGRKPGRKSATATGDRSLQEVDGNVDKPKRRGRPPKNKNIVPPPAPQLPQGTGIGQENENQCSVDAEEFDNFEKRLKLQIPDIW